MGLMGRPHWALRIDMNMHRVCGVGVVCGQRGRLVGTVNE
jgi:hypothetical protein